MGSIVEIHYLLVIIFIGGYLLIAIESFTQLNKATAALFMAVASWVLEYLNPNVSPQQNQQLLVDKLGELSQVIFFLIAALTIVEVINAHHGFKLLTDCIKVRSKRKFLWFSGLTTFFLSAVLDNLTTSIVMVAMIRKLVHEKEEGMLYSAAVVVAANAGGVWTPIGDVTSTMLWIGGQISPWPFIRDLILPSIISVIITFTCFSFMLKGQLKDKEVIESEEQLSPIGKLIFYVGLGVLISVPVFKELTGLPPFMGAFLGLAVVWTVTDVVHRNRIGYEHLRVPHILSKVDMSSVLFFIGILLCVSALDATGLLKDISISLSQTLKKEYLIVLVLGFVSAIIDNVPLVAATQSMYSLNEYPINSELWQLIAYVAGTGGSIFVIGSSAGVAVMGIAKLSFGWWCRHITLPVLAGYFSGMLFYLMQSFAFWS